MDLLIILIVLSLLFGGGGGLYWGMGGLGNWTHRPDYCRPRNRLLGLWLPRQTRLLHLGF